MVGLACYSKELAQTTGRTPTCQSQRRERWAVGLAFVPATLLPLQGSNPQPPP